jgi:hypothetical protein
LLNDQSGSVLGDSTVLSWAGCHKGGRGGRVRGDEVTAPAAMRRLQGRGWGVACHEIHRALGGRRRSWGAGDKATVPAATHQIQPPHAGSGLHTPDRGRQCSLRLAALPRSATACRGRPLRRGRRRLPRPAAPPWLAIARRGCNSVEKGRRRDEGGSGGAAI